MFGVASRVALLVGIHKCTRSNLVATTEAGDHVLLHWHGLLPHDIKRLIIELVLVGGLGLGRLSGFNGKLLLDCCDTLW